MTYTGRIDLKRFIEFCDTRTKAHLLEIRADPASLAESALGCWAGAGGALCATLNLDRLAHIGAFDRDTAKLFLDITREHVARFKKARAVGILGGRIGLLLCARSIADAIDSPSDLPWIMEAAEELQRQMVLNPPKGRDFGNGLAGVICGLIWLLKKNGEPSRGAICSLAKLLFSNLEQYPNGITFRDPELLSNGPICGLAHGLSGVAVTALELGFYLKNELFLNLADQLLACEATFKDPQHLWPDFRCGDDPKRNGALRRTGHMWCAGAVGIGLSYKYFTARTGQSTWNSPHKHTIHDTRRMLSNRVPREHCLCHGTGGALALLCSDDTPEHWDSTLLPGLIDQAEEIVNRAITQWDQTEKHFRGMATSSWVAYSKLSYFLGVSGLAIVCVKARMKQQQNDLLLPFMLAP